MKNSTMFGIIIILSFLLLAFMHEQVHVAIFNSYGIDSKVEYFKEFPHLVTVAEDKCPSDGCNLAHNINEIVSYQLDSFFIIIAF